MIYYYYFLCLYHVCACAHVCGPGSSVGIATDYGLDGLGSNPGGGEIFRTRPDRPWGPPSHLYNGYRVFPGGKDGRSVVLTTPSSAKVENEYSYTSTRPLGPGWPVIG
jgi:hypothetical protein